MSTIEAILQGQAIARSEDTVVIEVHGAAGRNAAWICRHPSPLARSIKYHIAYWGNVTVRETGAG